MAAIVAFTLSLVVTFRSNSLICTVEPMGTCSLRYCIRLAMVSLAEKWNSWMPVSLAMCAMLVSFTPQPASRVMRPAACCWSSFSKGMPSSAVGCCPEVRLRSHPSPVEGYRHALSCFHKLFHQRNVNFSVRSKASQHNTVCL